MSQETLQDFMGAWIGKMSEIVQAVTGSGPIKVAPEGEAIGRVESSRGEITVMIIGDNSDKPYRVKIMNGSFRNLIALPYLVRNVHIADMPIIYVSLDYWPVEADR